VGAQIGSYGTPRKDYAQSSIIAPIGGYLRIAADQR
jgi:hypothetical protein